MGSFPNKVASQILKALFVDKEKVTTPGFYTNGNSGKGIYTDKTQTTVPLYVGLIAGGTAVNSIPDGTGSLNTILNDSVIVSSGTNSWPIQPTLRGLYEFTGTNNTTRKEALFQLVSDTTSDGAVVATIRGPLNPIAFAATGGTAADQPAHESVIGFFITTLESAKGIADVVANGAPTILAYGVLNNSKNIQQGDTPTFAANAIVINLE